MRTGLISAATLTAAAFVTMVQYEHHQEYPLTPGHVEMKLGKTQTENPEAVWIFGHAYPPEQVQTWYASIEGKYCTYGDRIYSAGSVPGAPVSYPQFVLALQQGFYFPELAGAGVRSDGEREILSHTRAYQTKKDGSSGFFRRSRN